MKKMMIGLLVICLLGLSACGETVDENRTTHFRKTAWGDSLKTVRKLEEQELFYEYDKEGEEALYYQDEVAGLPVSVYYNFDDAKLVAGAYFIDDGWNEAWGGEDYSPATYIDAFYTFQHALIEKYGEPTLDVMTPVGESEPLIEQYGINDALHLGYISFYNSWDVRDDLRVILELKAEDDCEKLWITYIHPEYGVEATPDADGL